MTPDYTPLVAEARDHLAESLHDDKTKTRLASIVKSTTWRRIEEFLVFRREQLYTETPKTTDELWKREGALQEIHALLRRGPLLVLQWQQWREASGELRTLSLPEDSPTEDGLG